MKMLNRFSGLSRRNAGPVAVLSLVAVLGAGCATNPGRVAQAQATDQPDEWATRIRSLPVEIHGAVPGETAAQTVAAVNHGVGQQAGTEFQHTGLSLYALPRVVVYVGGSSAPARDQYCELQPNTERPVPVAKSGVVVRSELCDGPRPVAFARITLADADPSPATLARGIEQLESSMVSSLPPPEPPLPEF
jgi:hypothetical protein